MAGDKQVICAKREAEYFFGEDWTDRNSLIRLEKFDFTCKSVKRIGCQIGLLLARLHGSGQLTLASDASSATTAGLLDEAQIVPASAAAH